MNSMMHQSGMSANLYQVLIKLEVMQQEDEQVQAGSEAVH